MRYLSRVIRKAISLRESGCTYKEIISFLNITVPKSTLATWCREVKMSEDYYKRIYKLNIENLKKARIKAVRINKYKSDKLFGEIRQNNQPISLKIFEKETAKIALSMLCLGEARKCSPKNKGSFYLGSSDYRIITIFLSLLKKCFDFKIEKVRCTVQCRADQDIVLLEKYWQRITKIPKMNFYKARIDPRTIGKPTQNIDYKGVLRVDYLDIKIQRELEILADLVYNNMS